MKMAKKQTSLSDLFSPKKKIRIESPASDLDSPSTSACISSTTSAALLNNATESPSPSALSSSPASAALLKSKDATTASKRQQQKHDYEFRRERGVVSGWLSEFPWLRVVERGFSTMERIKSDWRANLKPPRLSRLMFISIQGPSVGDYDATPAINMWYKL